MGNLKGLAIGIGSLPHKDAPAALDLIFKYTPQIPSWPQLPKRDVREGMIAQFSEAFPCLKVTADGIIFNPAEKEKELERFYEKIIAGELEYFKISESFASGLYALRRELVEADFGRIQFIKGQVTGPFTFSAGINDELGKPLLHDPVFMQVIIKGLSMKALWQVKFFESLGKKVIIFMDEPYLSCFGSAYTPINREGVINDLGELSANIKSAGALAGVHCCGNTDWSMFTDIETIDIISFDAFDFAERLILYADNLQKFLRRGGMLCWGIIPTQLFTGEETPDLFIRKIKDNINKLAGKGLEEDLLLENLLVSPSCGLGTFTPEKAEKILQLLSETSSYIRKTW